MLFPCIQWGSGGYQGVSAGVRDFSVSLRRIQELFSASEGILGPFYRVLGVSQESNEGFQRITGGFKGVLGRFKGPQ